MGIQVLQPGLLTTVQDQGRFGHQRIGMSPAGAMDLHAMRLANLLVDNDRDEAVLEMTMLGPKLQFTRGCVFAVTGADMGARLDGEMVPWGCAVTAPAGSVLQFGAARSGCRAYLAVAGGFDVPVLYGSKSTLLRSALGGFQGRKLEAEAPDRGPAAPGRPPDRGGQPGPPAAAASAALFPQHHRPGDPRPPGGPLLPAGAGHLLSQRLHRHGQVRPHGVPPVRPED